MLSGLLSVVLVMAASGGAGSNPAAPPAGAELRAAGVPARPLPPVPLQRATRKPRAVVEENKESDARSPKSALTVILPPASRPPSLPHDPAHAPGAAPPHVPLFRALCVLLI
jgi:hypothetical protein